MTATTDRPSAPHGLMRGALKLAEALATPLVPGDYLDLIDPLRSGADLRGRIVAVTPETADAATVTIRPGRAWRGHVPGQFIRVGVDVDGVRHWRAYSLTSRVGEPAGTISITVKTIPDGVVSHHLVRTATPGQLIMLDQATGDFVLPTPAPAKVLFLTAGSGVTPVMGMLRNRLDDLADVVHLHAAPRAQDVVFGPELRRLDAEGRIRLVEWHDNERGLLDLTRDLDVLVPDWRERETWTCGPTGLLDAAELNWAAAELTDRLHTERFRPTFVEPGDGGEITFLHSDVTVDADGSTPILDAAEDAGVPMPSGCRMGICFGCVSTLRQGTVRDLRTGEITSVEPGEDVTVQTCVTAVAGSCDIER